MSQLAVVSQSRVALSNDDLDILRRTKFKNFEPEEMSYAAKISGLLSLNPFLNQIHFVKRRNKDGSYAVTAQVGIDGFRLTAERTGAYAGSDDAIFEYNPDDKLKRLPVKASVTVYKMMAGQRCAYSASARWSEYFPGSGPNSQMWDRMPHNQLAKCAEALALRKAFPAELSAVRSEEEMQQADNEGSAQTKALNDRIEKQVDAEDHFEMKERQESEAKSGQAPLCCGKSMKISKYIDRNFGHKPWWCPECNNKVVAE